MRISTKCLILTVVLAFGGPFAPSLLAANYPLELTNIRPGMHSASRLARAYPGIEYNIRAAVVGGDYPYMFSLTNAPSGMTIDPRTGEIRWSNPQANATPTIVVRDIEGAQVSATWTIVVTTSGFQFIDAVNGRNASGNGCSSSCGTGTRTNPWRTLSDMRAAGAPGAVTYFRAGTYTPAGLPMEGPAEPDQPELRVVFQESMHSVIWLAFPGDARPVIDYGHSGGYTTPRFRMRGANVYVDGLETRRSHIMAFQIFNEGTRMTGPTFRRMRMHTHGPGLDGSNAAFIMTTVGTYPMDYTVIQDSEFFGITGGNCALKLYAQNKPLVENNRFFDTGDSTEAVIAIKQDIRQFTVRANTLDADVKGIGGNMSSYNNDETRTTHGEILFNNVRGGMYAVDLNQNSQAVQVYLYRNTFVGRVQVRNADGNDGPFYFTRNVIVNNDAGTPSGSHVYHENVSAPSRVVHVDNLTGYPSRNLVDADGNLTSTYSNYLGTHGHQLTGGPRPPTNLRIIP